MRAGGDRRLVSVRVVSRLDRLPIRWRLGLASAGLTLLILLLFAVVFGTLTADQLRDDLDDELATRVDDARQQLDLQRTLDGRLELRTDRRVVEAVAAGDAVLRLVDSGGRVIFPAGGTPDLGPPTDPLHDAGGYRVATRPIYGRLGQPIAFVQYAKPKATVEQSIDRVQLLLAIGVLAGTGLALLAGLAVARRAMAPIASLTGAAKEIARTRDPGGELPQPAADDEVADLARTLERMLRALDEARGETEAALARQREFVADASHELRTPLTSVLANLELLEASLSGEDEEVASSALRSSRRMRRLVADLLLLARADAGRRAPRRPTDLAQVAGAAAGEVAPIAAEHELELDVAPGLTVDAVPDDLHRLVLNLLENAVRHTPPGTRVRVTGRLDHGAAALAVEDDGPGIPAEIGERVFERFVRASGRPGPGSGLGLAIVRAVAESHGGKVALEAGPDGRGTRVTVRLPLAAAAPAAAPAG